MSAGENGPRSWYTASGFACPFVRMVAATVASCSGVVPYREHVTAGHQGEFGRGEQSVPDDELVCRPRPRCGRAPVDVDTGTSCGDQHDVALAGGDQCGRVEDCRDPQRARSSGAGTEAELQGDVVRSPDRRRRRRRAAGYRRRRARPVRQPARSRSSRGPEAGAPAPCCGHRRWRRRETGARARGGWALDFSTVRP